jgi:hypothetical protein
MNELKRNLWLKYWRTTLLSARTADADRGSLAKGGEEKSPYVSNLS